jgi:hypothetical protein
LAWLHRACNLIGSKNLGCDAAWLLNANSDNKGGMEAAPKWDELLRNKIAVNFLLDTFIPSKISSGRKLAIKARECPPI